MMHSLPLANTILAYHVPYVMVGFLCFIVLPIEYCMFWILQRKNSFHFLKTFLYILLANIISLIAGFIFSAFIPPVSIKMTYMAASPDYLIGIFLGYIFAFLSSWFIEYHIIRKLSSKNPLPKLVKTVGYANMASYFVLYAITFIPSTYN